MRRLSMSVIRPKRRAAAGYVARWTDPVSGKRQQRLLNCRKKRDAYDAASELAEQIESGMDPDGMSWLTFCERYEAQAIGRRGAKSLQAWQTVKNFVEEYVPLQSIRSANNLWLDRFHAAFERHKPEASINTQATYLARLRAALNWAVRKRYLENLPYFDIERESNPRSRAVKPREFERMLAAISKVRPRDAHLWRRLLRGQFFTGLRIGELLDLSWDEDADVRIVQRAHPLIELRKQKNKKRQTIPLVPQAWEIIADSPVRTGPVFPIPGKAGQMTSKSAIRVIAKIGEKAEVVTNKDTGKTATSHDIRRAFFDWADDQYGEAIASKLMRHGDKETTLVWYNTNEADRAAELLWGTQ
jgi:integrase